MIKEETVYFDESFTDISLGWRAVSMHHKSGTNSQKTTKMLNYFKSSLITLLFPLQNVIFTACFIICYSIMFLMVQSILKCAIQINLTQITETNVCIFN